MTSADIDFGMQVKAEAGWNQTRRDWQRFLALRPDGCFVATWQDRPVGTVTTCVFQAVAWVGMMLVRSEYRRRGIGRALMTRAIQSLEGTSATSIRLDATPMGRPLYKTLGFEDQYELIRFGGQPMPTSQAPTGRVEPMDSSELGMVRQLDGSAIGVDRQALVEALAGEYPADAKVYRDAGNLQGYLFSRSGTQATQIGPCIARSQPSGQALLADAFTRFSGQEVFVDVPAGHHGAVAAVQSAGLRPRRSLMRMCRGPDRREHLPRLWASSGPEKG
jgi:GNAT superfamily N-acetyltransferase